MTSRNGSTGKHEIEARWTRTPARVDEPARDGQPSSPGRAIKAQAAGRQAPAARRVLAVIQKLAGRPR
jgi:hypothetical protein